MGKRRILFVAGLLGLLLSGCPNPQTPPEKIPGEVSGVKTEAGNSQVTLTWTNPGDSDLNDILLSWSPEGGLQTNPLAVSGAATPRGIISGLTNGTAYTFTLRSRNTSGKLSSGVTVSATPQPQGDTQPPGPVTGLSAVAGTRLVTLTWADPEDEDLDRISLTWVPSGGSTPQPLTVTPGTGTALVEGLETDIPYTFSLQTVDQAGNTGPTTEKTATPTSAPDTTPPVASTEPTFSGLSQTSVHINWTAGSDDQTAKEKLEYRLVKSTDKTQIDTLEKAASLTGTNLVMDWTAGVSQKEVTGLTPGSTWWFALQVQDGNGNRALYPLASVTTQAPDPSDTTPPVPGSGITFTSTTTNATTVTWGAAADTVTPVSGLQYKLLQASASTALDTLTEADAISTAEAGLVMDWTAATLSKSVSGLAPGSTWWFAAVVQDAAGNKALYAPASVTTTPAADVNLAALEVVSPSGPGVSPQNLVIKIRFNKSLNTAVKGYLEYDHVPRIYRENPSKFAPGTMGKMEIQATVTFETTALPNDTAVFTPLYGYASQAYGSPKVGGFEPATGLGMTGPTVLSHSFSTSALPLTNALGTEKWNDQNIYFMLTDRFNDGDAANNQFIFTGDLDHVATDGKTYQGGDFPGITAKLDYLEALGITTLWITAPVLQSWENATYTSYHGYWAQDFLAVDPHLGTMKDLRTLVSSAHAKGIKVIMDVVINHTGSLFNYPGATPNIWEPTFNSVGTNTAAWLTESWATNANRKPPYFGDIGTTSLWDFFTRKGGNATTGSGAEILQGDFAGLRDVNTPNPAVRAKMKAIFKWWIANTDVDGFRIDTVKHVEGDYWTDFCTEIRTWAKTSHGKDFYMVAEVYDGSTTGLGAYTTSGKLDSVLGFQMAEKIFDWNTGDNNTVFKDAGAWTNRPKTLSMEQALSATSAEANLNAGSLHTNGDGLSARQKLGYFLDNHDLNRFLNDTSAAANGAPGAGELANLRTALAWLYTWEGIPVLYYGTEQNYKQTLALNNQGEHGNGLGNVNKGNRPNLWQVANSTQGSTPWNQNHDTFRWISGLNQVRNQYSALRRGAVSIRWTDDGTAGNTADDGILAFLRKGSTVDEDILVVINTHPTQYSAPSGAVGNDLGTDWPVGTMLEVVTIPGFDGPGATGQVDTDGGAGQTWASTVTTAAQTGKTSAVYFQVPPNSVRILKKKP